MTDAMSIAKGIIEPVVRFLLTDRRRLAERSLSLAQLINVTVTDDYKRRKLRREIEAICDLVAQRLDQFCSREWAELDDNDRQAALNVLMEAFEYANLSDEAFFKVNADPIKLARQLRANLQEISRKAWLGESALAFCERLLDECCMVYAQLAVHLSSFTPRGIVELLNRASSLSEKVELLFDRLPVRTLNSPFGTELDAEFQERYLEHVSTTFDELDLFGISVNSFRPRTRLSVAYISLSVSTDRSAYFSLPDSRQERGPIPSVDELDKMATMRVERALSSGHRILIRGEAGSGKTTLVQWLAVNAARGSFVGDLAGWNGLVPFLIKLRNYVGARLPGPERFLEGTADPIAALMPQGWAHRKLAARQALLLIDGVDELPVGERRAVRAWIRALIREYPNSQVVVTSRPSAAAARWLSTEEFASANMEPMGQAGMRELIAQWHSAIAKSKDLPCTELELPRYERALLAQIDSSPHLQVLATNPLLCAMLCVLNLDRRTALPNDRMSIYAAALELLLERRDTERGIPGQITLRLDIRGKLQILQYLAWRLSLNNRTELSREEAIRRLTERLVAIRESGDYAETILDYLIQRSGVIREPVVGRLDFIHRTFQEYLTAQEAAEQGDVGFLIERAHLDGWREIVVMAAGHANSPTRHDLLNGILTRADSEPAHTRKLRLVAAASLETLGPIDSRLQEQIDSHLSKLVPPRRLDEVYSLVSVGISLLRHIPHDTVNLSLAAATAIVNVIQNPI